MKTLTVKKPPKMVFVLTATVDITSLLAKLVDLLILYAKHTHKARHYARIAIMAMDCTRVSASSLLKFLPKTKTPTASKLTELSA